MRRYETCNCGHGQTRHCHMCLCLRLKVVLTRLSMMFCTFFFARGHRQPNCSSVPRRPGCFVLGIENSKLSEEIWCCRIPLAPLEFSVFHFHVSSKTQARHVFIPGYWQSCPWLYSNTRVLRFVSSRGPLYAAILIYSVYQQLY